MAEPDIFVPTRTRILQVDGRRIKLIEGVTTVRRGHPLLDGREHLFRPLEVEYDVPAPPTRYTCETCGYQSSSERGLRIHQGREHKDNG